MNNKKFQDNNETNQDDLVEGLAVNTPQFNARLSNYNITYTIYTICIR